MRRISTAFLFLFLLAPVVLLAGCMREENDFLYDLDGAPKTWILNRLLTRPPGW